MRPNQIATSIIAATALGLLVTTTPAATAAANPTLGFPTLGLGQSATFAGRSASVSMSIPVPPGSTPERLRGQLQVPVEYQGGSVEVYQGDTLLTRQELTVDEGVAEVSLPLAGVEVSGNLTLIRVRTLLSPGQDNWCVWTEDMADTMLRNAVVDFSGRPKNPEFIADFIPPVMEKLSIFVPAEPDEAETAAALEVATAMGFHFSSQHPEILVTSLAEGSSAPAYPGEDFERQILIRAEGTPATELINAGEPDAFLRLSGEGSALLDQARLISSELLPLANGENAVARNLPAIPDLAPEASTIGELGNYRLESEALGRTSVSVGLDRSMLGAFPGDINLHLTGSYTPLPENNNGQILYRIGSEIIDQQPLDDIGVIDRELHVPRDRLGRFTQVEVELVTTGDLECGTAQPVGLRLDADSAVATELIDAPLEYSFQALPQAFLPNLDVALAENSAAEMQRAVDILIGLQSMTSARLRPQVVSWENAAGGSRPALLIDSAGAQIADLDLPLQNLGGSLSLDETPGEISVEGVSYGAIQAGWDEQHSRMVLAAGSTGRPELLDELLDWLSADENRWSQLSGQVLIQTEGQDPVDVNTMAQHPESDADSPRNWWILGGGLLVLAVIAAGLVVWLRGRTLVGAAEPSAPQDKA